MPEKRFKEISSWLSAFETALGNKNASAVANLFVEDGYWRDYLPFGWDLQTIEGRSAIVDFAQNTPSEARDFRHEGDTQSQEGFFTFETQDGLARGYIRLKDGLCHTLFTMLTDFHQHPKTSSELDVLVVGGGQCGLALGAQLSALGVSYLIVDKHPRPGDQWRSRYDSLVLHDPVWYDHMPFKPFPDDWPVFTPKDQMGDWLERYAADLDLKFWGNTEFQNASFDPSSQTWTAEMTREGKSVTLQPKHIVMALGLSGFPNVPEFEGRDVFAGAQMHSSAYKAGSDWAGKNVVVVGANNSAHDIASNLVHHGAHPTMIQRSSSLVVKQNDYCNRLLGPLFSAEAVAKGITTDKADILQASVPLRLMEQNHRKIWEGIRAEQREFYGALEKAGFALDFAEDGAGLGLKYRRTASGYYIDVGASEMIVDGRIKLQSGSSVSYLSNSSLHLENGAELPADAIVYATGYGDMTDWVAKFMGRDIAENVGPCWGYGSKTKGDPGPWLGELRNMWKPTAQKGLWFMGGNLSQARFFSRILALQISHASRE